MMITLFEEKIVNYFKNKHITKVLVAFSGGSDSTALLDCLVKHRECFTFSISACHVNHGIRGDAAKKDADFCEEYCLLKNIDFYLRQINVPKIAKNNKESIEAVARNLRYEELFIVAKEQGVDKVITAHHKDDRTETFFIKLFQGGSILNSAGFSYKKESLLRPLLDISKIEIEKYIQHYSLEHIEDETNISEDYLRNWVRHSVIKTIKSKNEYFIDNVIQFQEEANSFKDYFEQKTSALLIDSDNSLYTRIDKKEFLLLHDLEKKYVFSKLFSKYFRLEKKHIEKVLNIVKSCNSKRICLPRGFILEVSYNSIRFFKKEIVEPFEYNVDSETKEFFITHLNKKMFLSGFSAKDILIVRNRKDGDRFINKKLKDIFIDKKIELFIRDTSVVIEHNDQIVWVENISNNNKKIRAITEAIPNG